MPCRFTNCKEEELPLEPENPEEIEDIPSSSAIDTLTTSSGVQFVRTPDKQFENLPDWPYPYQYVEIDGLRQAYAESGPADGPGGTLTPRTTQLVLSLYRKMIPVLGRRRLPSDRHGPSRHGSLG